MNQIIPTILVADRLEFERRLGIMQGKISIAQMDIMDGQFVANTTFTDPKIAARYKVDYELDLMVEDPMPYIMKWRAVWTVKRAFVHVEIKKPLAPILKKIRALGWEAGISINPDTPWETVKPYLTSPHTPSNSPSERGRKTIISPPARGGVRGGGSDGEATLMDCVLFMTVYPGQNGAPFQKQVIPKIQSFHATHPKIPIAVDGGVNEHTLPQLLKAGATRFAVGNAIWSAHDPLIAYKKLLNH